ncbi:cell wall metabolism sensor histidine kinase WalK [Lacrimispora sp. NSJ-141]|uniref:histidine kinase n=1 Tax=Lientehia hominis TaxID=2897778 RepID=A0AAP2RJX3_9FIRM|nr:ATP-binding protein [Lientehia hominis]MCD2492844.1 cell wall metabolism sensor histidine kinase WalK [Lientehia hominis]
MSIRNGALVIFSKDKTREKKFKRLKSLRLIWFVLLVLIGSVPVVVINRIVLATSGNNEVQSRISRIQNQWMIVADQVSKSGYVDNPQNEVVESELVQMASLQDGRAIVVNQGFRTIKDTYDIDTGKYNISESVLKCFSGEANVKYSPGAQYIEFTQPIYSSDSTKVVGVMILSSSTRSLVELADKLESRIWMLEIIEFGILVVLSALLSSWMTRPFRKIAASLTHATENPLGEEIKVNDYTETMAISDAYNKTLKRLRTLDESRQQFVSNVSHELKTPITSIRVLADSLLSQEDVPAELYQEFMADISEEIDRESQIIEDLLTLVRLDKASTELNVTQINVNELLESILKRLKPIAQQKNVELVLESFRPVLAELDKTKFTLAISNLVENAIKYNNRDGWVKVSLNADHKFFYVKVADSGIGIPESDQEHVFERFYRVDKARSREAGGTGLGLAITKGIIYSHHGAIKLYSKENEGTTFTVRIPLIYIA